MLRCGSLTAHDFHTVCNFDVSDPLRLLIAISGLEKSVGLIVPTPSLTVAFLIFPDAPFAFPLFLHVKILPLFGLRKDSLFGSSILSLFASDWEVFLFLFFIRHCCLSGTDWITSRASSASRMLFSVSGELHQFYIRFRTFKSASPR